MASDTTCAGCAKEVGGETGVKAMKCSRCTKIVYCSRDCQKGDWKFHKRICVDVKEQEKKKKEEEKRKEEEKNKKSAEKKSAPLRPKKDDVVVDSSDEDIGDWYRHRETKLPVDHNAVPKKIQSPQQEDLDRAGSSAAASSWNQGGTTFEENDVSKKAQEGLKEYLGKVMWEDHSHRYRIDVSTVEGDASQGVSRKGAFFIYDLTVSATVQRADLLDLSDESKYGKLKINDLSNTLVDADLQLEWTGRVDNKDHIKRELQTRILEQIHAFQNDALGKGGN